MEIITTCRNSGLSDRQWCIQNDIPTSTFYLNVQKLQKEACEFPPPARRSTLPVKQDVVQLSVIEGEEELAADTQLAIALRIRDVHIDISNDASPAVITAALQALVTIC